MASKKQRAAPVRYKLTALATQAPWAESMRHSLHASLGTDYIGDLAVDMLVSGLAPNTYSTYGSAFNKYLLFCAEEGLEPLSAQQSDIVRFIAWVGAEGRVAAGSLQPYLSAINKCFGDHLLPPVALGPMVTAARRALQQCQQAVTVPESRVHIPADVVLSILRQACKLVTDCTLEQLRGSALRSLLDPLRCCLAVVTTFIFFCRASTGMAARRGDLVVDLASPTPGIYLFETHVKGISHLPANRKPLLHIPVSAHPELAPLLVLFQSLQQRCYLDHNLSLPEKWWSLPWDPPSASASSLLSGWLLAACGLVGATPPPGFSWSSHSLRKGAATAAFAQGVSLLRIKYYGGWASGSVVVERDYIDPTVTPSPGSAYFFGFLCPPAPMVVVCTHT